MTKETPHYWNMKERLCGINEDQGRLFARWTLAHSQQSEVKAYCILLLNF